ncbi:unnamed protein product [Arabidopsis thaliana]|uniref:(thale cress) hypothetical protein n=1 Tax=Arabidopsis thaliana TaxID=3702 RepID=A0A7G2E8A7_ARATH|nr:unnamed protein product [Arabidopsis thaliana]
MDEWFSYKNFLSEMRFVCALSYLTGDAYKWWLQEVDDRLYYKEPPITLWRDLKELLRNKYALQASNRSRKVSVIAQGGVTCYNCRKKGHLVATCPEKLELTNTSLESKLSSPNSSSEVVSQGLENSSSCVMHLFLSKDVDSGHIMEHENDKTEGSTKGENHHLVSTTSQACRAAYVSKITILNKKGPPYISTSSKPRVT